MDLISLLKRRSTLSYLTSQISSSLEHMTILKTCTSYLWVLVFTRTISERKIPNSPVQWLRDEYKVMVEQSDVPLAVVEEKLMMVTVILSI